MTFNMNQTKITKTVGELAFARMYQDNIAATVDPTISPSAALVPSQAVRLVNLSSGTMDSPIEVTPAAPTDDIFGFVVKGLRSDVYFPTQQVDIAIAEAIMIFSASGALTAGTRVGVNSINQVVDATSGTPNQIGVLLDKAVNEGDLVRVLIKVPGITVV